MLLLCAVAVRPQTNAVVLDKVIAVVNNRAILASDLDAEMRISALEPRNINETPDRRSALERLVSRALIQQQIRREEEEAAEPSADEIHTRITEIRRDLPACFRYTCTSDEGWSRFLADNHLTANQVEGYMRMRLQILAFIESRFRQGIRIPQEDIEQYYKQTLLPQYPTGRPAPSLEAVSHRIEEILLQQQVSNMFGSWLDNLRKQGDIEILDHVLDPDSNQPSTQHKGASPAGINPPVSPNPPGGGA